MMIRMFAPLFECVCPNVECLCVSIDSFPILNVYVFQLTLFLSWLSMLFKWLSSRIEYICLLVDYDIGNSTITSVYLLSATGAQQCVSRLTDLVLCAHTVDTAKQQPTSRSGILGLVLNRFLRVHVVCNMLFMRLSTRTQILCWCQ